MASPVRPIPEGYHSLTPHLVVRDANGAIEFYKEAFGAVELHRMPGPDGKSVMHAELRIGDSHFMVNDEFPDWGVHGPEMAESAPTALHIYVEDADALFARAIAAGAKEKMPLENQFWGDRYGKLVDPYGHHWSVGTRIEDVPAEEMAARAERWLREFGCNESGGPQEM